GRVVRSLPCNIPVAGQQTARRCRDAETFMVFGSAFLAICIVPSMVLADPPAGYTVPGAVAKKNTNQKKYAPREMLGTVRSISSRLRCSLCSRHTSS
ncbi:MAG: hypothetical protein AB7D42_04675, partial [Candidatus Methanomethylophilaceae archaeon]